MQLLVRREQRAIRHRQLLHLLLQAGVRLLPRLAISRQVGDVVQNDQDRLRRALRARRSARDAQIAGLSGGQRHRHDVTQVGR